MVIAMIPARMGSQRLAQKNLRDLDGVSLLARAIRRCRAAAVFDEIWVNAEHPAFAAIAAQEGARFHPRPERLASNTATSEDFVYEFLTAHACEHLVQVHSIAPLLGAGQIAAFVKTLRESPLDVLLSGTLEQIECCLDGEPINFSAAQKTNSQQLTPVQRITWSITGWRAACYRAAYEAGRNATWAGRRGFFPLDRLAGHIIKTEEDLRLAAALLPLAGDDV